MEIKKLLDNYKLNKLKAVILVSFIQWAI